jgi:hypothetical protein
MPTFAQTLSRLASIILRRLLPSSWPVCFCIWHTVSLSRVLYRTVLKIRQLIFSLHRMHSTDSGCVSHQSMDYHCPSRCSTLGLCVQGGPRRSGELLQDQLRSILSSQQKRHQSDAELNARNAKILVNHTTFTEKKWKDIQVGDVVRLESDDFIPADMIIISSSEPEGLCYIETSNLDGSVLLNVISSPTSTHV